MMLNNCLFCFVLFLIFFFFFWIVHWKVYWVAHTSMQPTSVVSDFLIFGSPNLLVMLIHEYKHEFTDIGLTSLWLTFLGSFMELQDTTCCRMTGKLEKYMFHSSGSACLYATVTCCFVYRSGSLLCYHRITDW